MTVVDVCLFVQLRPAAEDPSAAVGVRQRAARKRALPHVRRGGQCDITSCRAHLSAAVTPVCMCDRWSGSVSIRSLWPLSCAPSGEGRGWTSRRT